jgi:beta-galactosidase
VAVLCGRGVGAASATLVFTLRGASGRGGAQLVGAAARPGAMVLLHIALVAAAAAAPPTRSFQLGGALNNSFSKDGLPFTFMAGSMHYWRSKPSEWRPKLQLMRELGLNAVLTPTIWARHEALEGQFDFSGDVDVVKFVRTAEEEGLVVVMRLGSYATAEMDLGGLPFWLINKNISTIRSLDPVWQRYEQRYFRQLLRRLTPLQYNHPAGGGPVVCVQLGDDSDVAILHNAYYALMAQEFRRWGVTVPINTLINTGDSGWWGAWNQADVVRLPSASGVFTAFEGVNLGGLPAQLAWMRKQFPQNNPLVNFEYYAGWIDLEGAAHPNARTPTVEAYAAGLEQQLSSNISVSLYMACGGTNFGYTGGGEWQGSKSVPIISSYDYSAPITEGGDVGVSGTLSRALSAVSDLLSD